MSKTYIIVISLEPSSMLMVNLFITACPKKCPANESCSCQMADCERSCESRRYPCDPATPFCETKCYCNSGFIRSSGGGTCIPYEQCGPIWGDLEIAEL